MAIIAPEMGAFLQSTRISCALTLPRVFDCPWARAGARLALPLNLGSPESCRRFPLSLSEGERAEVRGLIWGFRDAKRVRIQGGSLLPARRSRAGKSLEKPAAAGFLACGQQTLPGVSAFWAKAEEERKDSEVEAEAAQSHLKPTTSHVLGRGLRHASQAHARYMRHTSQVQARYKPPRGHRANRATDLRGIVFREVGSPELVRLWQATG